MNRTPDTAPRLSIGLPVYNGEAYLAESLNALLGQSFTDFELIISDNASTDATGAICRRYAAADPRIRYLRQERNIGSTPNHNYVFAQARGGLFKWASHDDLYARDLLLRCVAALEKRPHMVLAHSYLAIIDEVGAVTGTFDYRMATDSPDPVRRFADLLVAAGGDDFYGVIRTEVLRSIPRLNSYHHADRTFVVELALQGPFYQVPEVLYFRRDIATRVTRSGTKRAWAAKLDPRRDDPVRHPTARLLAEYVWGFVAAIRRAPLTGVQRRSCYRHLLAYLASRARPASLRSRRDLTLPGTPPRELSGLSRLVERTVPGRAAGAGS